MQCSFVLFTQNAPNPCPLPLAVVGEPTDVGDAYKKKKSTIALITGCTKLFLWIYFAISEQTNYFFFPRSLIRSVVIS